MWEKLENSFSHEENVFVVSGGFFDFSAKSKLIDPEKARGLILQLKSCDYVRVGASRNAPLPPHFAAKFYSNEKAKIFEYISLASRPDGGVDSVKIKRDLLLMADAMFFDNPDLQEIEFPSELDIGPIEGYGFEVGENVSILKRR